MGNQRFRRAGHAALALLSFSVVAAAQRAPRLRTVVANHWAFDVPATWVNVAPPTPTVVAIAREPVQRAGLAVNVNLNTETFSGAPLAYASAAVAGLVRIARVENQQQVTLGGYPGLLVTASWRGGAVPYRTLQFITARDGTGYVLTCTASIAAWNVARPACNAVLRSLRPTDR